MIVRNIVFLNIKQSINFILEADHRLPKLFSLSLGIDSTVALYLTGLGLTVYWPETIVHILVPPEPNIENVT